MPRLTIEAKQAGPAPPDVEALLAWARDRRDEMARAGWKVVEDLTATQISDDGVRVHCVMDRDRGARPKLG